MLSCAPPRKSRENFTARRLCKSMVGAEKDIQIDSLNLCFWKRKAAVALLSAEGAAHNMSAFLKYADLTR